ncbi:hypothetical protein ACIFOE_04990 [Paenibacillus sp. NRS-1783]|uniref:hypothetical protein n=1 Tax=Paenibacillus sp. NRS-1783 TaxID=3233907 RepID=UPI003D293B1F
MKKWFTGLMVFMGLFVLPMMAFAEGNPMDEIDKFTKPSWAWLSGLGFVFTPLNLVFSILIFIGFISVIIRIVYRIVRASSGKAVLRDKGFWIEVGIIVFVILLFFTGAFGAILKQMYNWTEKQDIGKEKSAMQIERSVDSFLT